MSIFSREHSHIPSWKDAPAWANFLTRDVDGTWYWWAQKPEAKTVGEPQSAHGTWFSPGQNACATPKLPWTEAIESRFHRDDTVYVVMGYRFPEIGGTVVQAYTSEADAQEFVNLCMQHKESEPKMRKERILTDLEQSKPSGWITWLDAAPAKIVYDAYTVETVNCKLAR